MPATLAPAPARPIAGGVVWALGWALFILAVLASFAVVTGPVAYWSEELSPPATGGILDNVIPAAVSGGLLVGLATAGLLLTHVLRAIGRRLHTRRAEHTLATDHRPPVLYLRPFRDDESLWSTSESMEHSLAAVLRDAGPVIAVGRPMERLPPLGAARLYFSDEEWQPAVRELMATSALTILRPGTSAGVQWELATLVERVPPTRFLLALPASFRSDAGAWTAFRDAASTVFPRALPVTVGDASFMTFDADWTPSLVRTTNTASVWSSRSSLRDALRPICERHGLTVRRKSVGDISVERVLAFCLATSFGSVSLLPSDLHWRALSASEGFTISMPGKYYEKRDMAEIRPGIQLQSHEYGVLKRNRSLEFIVGVATYTNVDLTTNPAGMFQGARDAVVARLAGSLVAETPVQLGPYPGRDWTIAVPARKAIARTRMYLAGPQRTIQVFVAMPEDGSEDAAARQFFDSLRVR